MCPVISVLNISAMFFVELSVFDGLQTMRIAATCFDRRHLESATFSLNTNLIKFGLIHWIHLSSTFESQTLILIYSDTQAADVKFMLIKEHIVKTWIKLIIRFFAKGLSIIFVVFLIANAVHFSWKGTLLKCFWFIAFGCHVVWAKLECQTNHLMRIKIF